MKKIHIALLMSGLLSISAYAVGISEQMEKATRLSFQNGILGNVDDNFAPCRLGNELVFYADGQNLYMQCVSEIDSTFSMGKESKRDQASSGDFIMLRLITVPDQNFAYTYVFTPLRNKEDYTLGLGISANYDWNSDYDYESIITKTTWTIKARIPWKGMRTGKTSPFNVGIIINRWMQNDGRSFNYPHLVRSMGENYYRKAFPLSVPVRISRDLDPQARFYYTAKYDLLNKQSYKAIDYTGLDFAFRPQQNGSIKLTLQPDFSDIPMDTEDDVYNTLYKPWLQENRFFFKEDLDLLSGSNSYWYSRNIISPFVAIKYSLIQPQTSLIVLSAKDQKKQIYNGSDDFYNALSIRQKLGKLQISLYAYNRMDEKAEYHNEVSSAKVTSQVWGYHSLSLEFGKSLVRDSLSAKHLSGTAGTIAYGFSNTRHTIDLSGKFIDDTFRADMGNISLINRNTFDASYTNYLNFPKAFISDFSNSLMVTYVADHTTNERIEAYLAFRNQSKIKSTLAYFGLDINCGDESYNGTTYGYQKAFFSLGSIYRPSFAPFIRIGRGRNLVYRLEKQLDYLYCYSSLESVINPHATIKLDVTLYKYDHEKTASWDNEYLFANLDYAINFNTGFNLNLGLRFNDTEVPSSFYDGYFGYYFNSEWQISKAIKLNLGYQSKADHYTYSLEGDPQEYHLYDITSQNIYLKTSVSF
ncbi:MAG: hypothetical protein PHI68_07285 [Candidatus Cloacimonetes bacterium]|nr:hypothetical protein [Candidatus Cloacimonadota bacterium]